MLSRLYAALVPLLIIGRWWSSTDSRQTIFVSGLIIGGVVPLMWLDTLVTSGLRALGGVPVMARLLFASVRGKLLMQICVGSVLFITLTSSPYRVQMSVALTVTGLLLWLQPPFALLLGESSETTGRLLRELSSAAFPLRIVGLLDQRRLGYFVGSFSWLSDNLRTTSYWEWRAIVDELADLVPLVVLDARTISPLVADEVGEILGRPDRLRRTVFVVNTAPAPALVAHGVTEASKDVRTVREGELRSSLGALVARRRANSPST